MKTLHLLRHAKSSWKDKQLNDIDRPLSQRGKDACHTVGNYLTGISIGSALVLLSPAKRAQQTWSLIYSHLIGVNQAAKQSQTLAALYTFDAEQLKQVIKRIDNAVAQVVIVGHNPAISDILYLLTGQNIAHVPTCSFITLTSDIREWREAEDATFKLANMVTPKLLKSSH
ncbi:SixA phosphatase family protein [Thalassotalea fusca]